MKLKPASAKAKGRKLQGWVRDQLITHSNGKLKTDDVRSTSSGATGEDVQLSPAAREIWPFKIECKNKGESATHTMYKQAEDHDGDYQPMLVVKQGGKKPLVVVDAEWFFTTWESSLFNWKDIY